MNRTITTLTGVVLLAGLLLVPPSAPHSAVAQGQVHAPQTAQYGGINFTYDGSLATNVTGKIVPAIAANPNTPYWTVAPQHVELNFDGFAVTTGWDPVIDIYQGEAYNAAGDFTRRQFSQLRTFLTAHPTLEAGYISEDPATNRSALPDQIINAARIFHAKGKYLSLHNGSAVRFLAEYAQDAEPITPNSLAYLFLGVVGQGRYYVQAIFPAGTTAIKGPPSPLNSDVVAAYNRQAVPQLDALPDAGYTPDLGRLDNMMASLTIDDVAFASTLGGVPSGMPQTGAGQDNTGMLLVGGVALVLVLAGGWLVLRNRQGHD